MVEPKLKMNDLRMEAYKKLETLSDDDVRLIINIIDKTNPQQLLQMNQTETKNNGHGR